MKSDRPVGWPHKIERSKRFSTNEANKALQALKTLPASLMSKSLKGFYRMSRSKDFPNPASHGGNFIVMYDTAFSRSNLSRILAHELAHQLYSEISSGERDDYKRATNWLEIEGKHQSIALKRASGFVKEEARMSAEEDFANNLEFYIFERSRLKSIAPSAHGWIEKLFGDKFNLRSECGSKN